MRRQWKGKSALLITVVLAVVGLFGCTHEVAPYYTGTVEGEIYYAMTSISGKLDKVYVAEGDRVVAGDLIGELEKTALEIELEGKKAVLRGAQADFDKVVSGIREGEINQIRQQIEQQNDQILILQDQLNYAVDQYNKIKSLYDSGATSKQELDAAKLSKDNATAVRDQSKAQKALLQESLNLALEGATDAEIESVKSRVDTAQWAVEAVEDRIEDTKIYANHSGIVETLYFSEGEQYGAASRLAEIVDIENADVRIYVEEKNLHKISVNDQTKIGVDYNDAIQIAGKITYISSEGEFTPKNLESKENRQEVVYEVRIKIDNSDSILKPGMLVDVYLGDDVNE